MNQKEMSFLRGVSQGKNFYNTVRAINIATDCHEGQTRKSGEPYIVHPMRVASTLYSCGIVDDYILASALLHDVLEDCEITRETLLSLGIHEKVVTIVELLSKDKGMTVEYYYKRMIESGCIEAMLVKIADRTHNISTMVGGFSIEKMKEYIVETESFIYPFCKKVRRRYPEYSDPIFTMKYKIEEIVNAVNALIQKEEENKALQRIIEEKSAENLKLKELLEANNISI